MGAKRGGGKELRKGMLGSLRSDQYIHTAIFKMDNQQGPPVEHRELCSMLFGSLDGRGGLGENTHTYTCIYVAESLCCVPETITTLLTGYTSI